MDEEAQIWEFSVSEDGHGARLDKALAALMPEYSRARLQALIQAGEVTLNGTIRTAASFKVKEGDEVAVTVPPAVDDDPIPENIPLDIVYEDEDLLVINKAADMVVHPAVGNLSGTLVNALLYHCGDSLSGIGGVKRPGIVHRLDKETSGLMVVAKNDHAHHGLSDQLKDRSLSRVYQGLVWKAPTLIKGSVDAPVGRHATNRLKMAVMKSSGREAVTHYHVLERYRDAVSLIECKLETGRTHQIRVHMQFIRHPLLGDPLYGLPAQEGQSLLKKEGYDDEALQAILAFPRQALHAYHIGFIHPSTGEEHTYEADMPEDMQNLKKLIKTNN
jgi:23S rRNA pseudouridine1911/1915/1917 synthase